MLTIELKKENFFINDKQILFDINLEARQGEIIAILGQNGSGKSTLFKLIKKKYKNLYNINQNINISTFSDLTVYENLLLSDKNRLNNCEIINYIDLFNPGLKDKMAVMVKELSGGQRQALALAMAFLQKPKILALDEHTSALDLNSAYKIMDLTCEHIKKNHTTALMITHNIDHALDFASRIIIISDGKITFDVKNSCVNKIKKSDILNSLGYCHRSEG